MRDVRERAAELLETARRLAGDLGARLAELWSGLSSEVKRVLMIGAAAVVALIVVLAVVVPALPCRAPGGDSCPPSDELAQLVPADALAYVHANLDPETEQYAAAAAIGDRLPVIGGQISGRALALIPGPDGHPPDFDRDLRPWLGAEVALALLGGGGRFAERVELLEIADPAGAAAYADALFSATPVTEEYEGHEISADREGLATTALDGFLVIGSPAGVRAIIDAAAGASLADDPEVSEIRDRLPSQRFLEAYVSAAGARQLVAGNRGALGALTPLLAPGSTQGAAASLTAGESELVLAIRSALDPDPTRSQAGFFAAFPPFEPALADRLGAGTLAYLGLGQPSETVGALLAQASAQAPGIASGFEGLARRLRAESRVDIEAELLGALGGEAAFALEPGSGADSGLPYLEFVAGEVDTERARRALASLQGPLAQVFESEPIEGVEASTVRVSPTVELTYTIIDGLALAATDPAGVAALVANEGARLADSELYLRAIAGFDQQVSLLGFFDLGGLVALGERVGLAEDPLYATFAGEFRRLDALGLAVTDDGAGLSTDARLLFGD